MSAINRLIPHLLVHCRPMHSPVIGPNGMQRVYATCPLSLPGHCTPALACWLQVFVAVHELWPWDNGVGDGVPRMACHYTIQHVEWLGLTSVVWVFETNFTKSFAGSTSINTDKADAANATLPAKCRCHGHHVKNTSPHSRCTLMVKCTVLIEDEQCWQASTARATWAVTGSRE